MPGILPCVNHTGSSLRLILMAKSVNHWYDASASRWSHAHTGRWTTLSPMPKNPFVLTLAAAADQSILGGEAQQTVIAGCHWLSDWGREWTATGCSPPAKRACS